MWVGEAFLRKGFHLCQDLKERTWEAGGNQRGVCEDCLRHVRLARVAGGETGKKGGRKAEGRDRARWTVGTLVASVAFTLSVVARACLEKVVRNVCSDGGC